MKLSIIVPVYGVEKYILEFAESLLSQLNEQVELIVINDGTKDRSIDLFKEYVTKNNFTQKNIIWLEQENQGQSVARNYGISLAKGEYVTFLDPDDYVENYYIHILLDNINQYMNVDIYHFNAYVVKDNQIFSELKLADNDNFFSIDKNNLKCIFKKRMWFSWLRVVRRDLLDNDFFPEGVNFQDMMAFPKLYKKLINIKNIDNKLIYYRIHEQSSVHKFSDKLIRSLDYGIELYKNSEYFSDKMIFNQFLMLRLMLSFQNLGFKATSFWYKSIGNKKDYLFYYCFCYSLVKKLYYKVRK